MHPLWSPADFIAAIAPLAQVGDIRPVSGISIDSRTLDGGDAFFAIKGDAFDGHRFADAALEAGASVVVLEAAQQDRFGHLAERAVFVDDVLIALERLGRAARARCKGKILAITGSVGKTSTKDALRKALEPSGKVHAAVASFNNHWGVPLTLARMPQDTDFGVFEIGMNHAGEIRVLVDMVRPDIAMITTIVAAHIGNFASIDEIAAAKAEIFEGLVPGGVALINGDNEFADFLANQAKACGVETLVRFGSDASHDICLKAANYRADGSDLDVCLFGQALSVHLATPGEHIAQNSLAVLAAVHLAGANVAAAMDVLGQHGATKGRGERHSLALPSGQALLIDESYNANPSSVAAALATLGLAQPQDGGRKIAVLGDMLELGEESAAMHGGLLGDIEASGVDQVYLCGPMMRHLWDILPGDLRAHYADTSGGLIARLKHDLQNGDVVMVKGSLGSRMGPIVADLVDTFKN
ncbi:MAG: UDP-N-acetylmuramoylalanyl-D-glutamyl-2,6-diaminopimelate--D-alanyl-D-alanine ligase [Cohaesibacter sp.]|jgi:UDP-N-acetylmuramoyl-tripeptide--D-alanyl-D-alanine ligase|nr:UDP-N-acetylmuramoylalanyl-D-glutamyl-2,6-diaminopimelate--D-alanyl-D-alanine ligase [Cohaesibacter sp.]